MKPVSTAVAGLFALLACASGAVHAVTQPRSEWSFQVLLDDKPVGRHRFRVTAQGEDRIVDIEADFAVKLLGWTAYHYHHQATERWHGDCLAELESSTNNDGRSSNVRSERVDGALMIATGGDVESVPGCVMSFAYWNPAMQTQSRLLNAQTGRIESVRFQRIGSGTIEVHGQTVTAEQVRILGAAAPIDVWYAADGDWVGLDAVVQGRHRLSYRIP